MVATIPQKTSRQLFTVSQASKDVTRDGVKIVAGDYIGFSGGVILTDEKTRYDAAAALCDGMGAGDFDIMLLITGEGVTEEDGESLRASFAAKYKNTEVITIAGGQPIYDLIIVLE